MTPHLDDDGPLALTTRRFADSVHEFCDRRPVWDGGACRWSPPLYGRMRSALSGTRKAAYRIPTSSRTPCRTAVLDWLRQVDQTVARWGGGGGTQHALRVLAERSWRPQDCRRLEDYTEQLAAWAAEATQLLGDAVAVVPLRGIACPACGDRWAYRHRDGENVRSPALTVSELGAECQSCAASWSTDQFEWLARLVSA